MSVLLGWYVLFHPHSIAPVPVLVPVPSHAGGIGRLHSDKGARGIACMRLYPVRALAAQGYP